MAKASLLVVLLGISLLFAVPAHAQVTGDNETATNETAATNETGNATGSEGSAAPPAPLSIVLTGHGEGGAFFFQMEGASGRNPTITVQPGQEVTVTLRTVSGAIHNFCTDATGEKKCLPLTGEGEENTLTFTAPSEPGSFQYWCDPHKSSGMKGTLKVGAAGGSDGASGGEAGGSEAFEGETVDLGDLGHPECAGTKIPAASAEKAVGGPTVSDYALKCKSGESTAQGRPAHPADYVIPASFGLIALGVLGVAWVNRAYRP